MTPVAKMPTFLLDPSKETFVPKTLTRIIAIVNGVHVWALVWDSTISLLTWTVFRPGCITLYALIYRVERFYVAKVVFLRRVRPWRARVTSVRPACLYYYIALANGKKLTVCTLPRPACLHALWGQYQISSTKIHTFPGFKTWQNLHWKIYRVNLKCLVVDPKERMARWPKTDNGDANLCCKW